jgi:cytochrome oxidase assembly protein ShyY1
MAIRFRFRFVPFIVATMLVVLGIALAQWQTRRGDEKMALQAQLEHRWSEPALDLTQLVSAPAAIEYRRVQVRGQFLPDWPIYLDNRPHNGIAGFYLLMPFKIAASNLHVLVARGWFPRNPADRTRMPAIPTPADTVEIDGVARRDIGHVMQLGASDALKPGAIVQNIEPAAFAASSGLQMQPVLIEQLSASNGSSSDGNSNDGLMRDWPPPATGVERHRAYAFQWYALSLMAFVFFVVTGFRREEK